MQYTVYKRKIILYHLTLDIYQKKKNSTSKVKKLLVSEKKQQQQKQATNTSKLQNLQKECTGTLYVPVLSFFFFVCLFACFNHMQISVQLKDQD